MKKLFLLITLLVLSPVVANAEECTSEMLKEYETYVSNIVITPTRLDDSNTFEIWVKGVSNGLVVEHGRTVLDEGFLGYAQSGDNYIARVYVGFGVCHGKTVKELKVDIPEAIEQCGDDCNASEDTTPPTVVEKPTTDTTVKQPTANSSENSTSSSTNSDSSSKVEEKPVEDNVISEPVGDSTQKEDNIENDNELTDIENSKEDIVNNDIVESENNYEQIYQKEKNDNDSEMEIIKNVIIFTFVSILFVTIYYIIQRRRLSK